jgi:dienelactone hydrolase
MAQVLLFHHSRGQTPGFHAFADGIRAAGHDVHTPDLFGGRTFDSIDDGMAHIRRIGFDDLVDRGVAAADDLPTDVVHAGVSFGVMVAQKLTQTRPGARGALLFESAANCSCTRATSTCLSTAARRPTTRRRPPWCTNGCGRSSPTSEPPRNVHTIP